MDIRKFFGGTPQAKPATARSKAATKQQEKRTSDSPVKKRPPKVESIDLDSEDSDESDIPRSLRNKNKKDVKKTRVVALSDSEDEMPKARGTTRRARIASSSPDISPPKAKKSKAHPSPSPVKKQQEEDEEEMETDSEDEFVEKASKRKGLAKGQKKLDFARAEKKQEPVVQKKEEKKREEMKINPSDFFENFGKSKVEIDKERKAKEKAKRRSDEENLAAAEKETAQKQRSLVKEPEAKKARKVEKSSPKKKAERDDSSDDEFVETPEKKKKHKEQQNKTPEKRKAESPKKGNSSKRKDDEKQSPKKKNEESEKMNQSGKKDDESLKKREAPKKVEPRTVVDKPKEPAPVFVPWVDKYRPRSLQQLVGQHGEKSPMNKLMRWLKGWPTWHTGEGAKIKRPKPPPFVETDGSPFKAVLLSGSPGIGKTTCATLACELLGLKVVEMNASDARNKKHLDSVASQLIGCHQIEEFLPGGGQRDSEVQHVLIMDEVDGMSGNEDRAGLSELIRLIKETRIPIICICNDRGDAKMRTLVNYTYDVRFPKPRVEMVLSRLMSIAAQEKVKLSKEDAMELIESSGHDVRQSIYKLQMRAAGDMGKGEHKDVAVNTFDAARRLLVKGTSLAERQQMFFTDYSIMPLFVQENYLKVVPDIPTGTKDKLGEELRRIRRAADLISYGDTVDRLIRSGGAWKLLNEQSMLSAALPVMALEGSIRSQIQFPGWLGRNSTANKRHRMARQILHHSTLKVSANPLSFVTDYVPLMKEKFTRPLVDKGSDGVRDVVDVMMEYDLLKDDVDAIAELADWPGKKDTGEKVAPKVKAALTRTLNKASRLLPYEVDAVSKKKGAAANEPEVIVDEDGDLVEKTEEEQEDEEEEEPLAVKQTSKAAATSKTKGKRK